MPLERLVHLPIGGTGSRNTLQFALRQNAACIPFTRLQLFSNGAFFDLTTPQVEDYF